MIRLGDGTGESHIRIEKAVDELWRYSGELVSSAQYEVEAGVDVSLFRNTAMEKIKTVFDEATLAVPENVFMQVGGKLEPNEAPEQTMLREIREEIGSDATIEQFVGRFETATANEPDFKLVSYVYHVQLQQAPQIAAEIAEMKKLGVLTESEEPVENVVADTSTEGEQANAEAEKDTTTETSEKASETKKES